MPVVLARDVRQVKVHNFRIMVTVRVSNVVSSRPNSGELMDKYRSEGYKRFVCWLCPYGCYLEEFKECEVV